MSARRYYGQLPDTDVIPIIVRFIDALALHAEELARHGMELTRTPLTHHRQDIEYTRLALQKLLDVRRAPASCMFRSRGRVLIGLPANEPVPMGAITTCAALLAGNTVLLRPATQTRAVAERLVELLDSCGLPGERLSLVARDKSLVAEALQHADHVLWLGSSATCREIGAQAVAASKTYTTEAEGFDIVVFDETVAPASLGAAARMVIDAVTRHDGQTCQGVRAVLVHQSCAAAVRAALEVAIGQLKVGPAEDPATDVTVLPRLLDRATLAFPEASAFTTALYLTPYPDEESMVRTLAANPFGLSASFFTQRSAHDILHGPAAHARVGRVLINAPPHVVIPGLPWGGYRKSGSGGPHGLLEEFADVVVIYRS